MAEDRDRSLVAQSEEVQGWSHGSGSSGGHAANAAQESRFIGSGGGGPPGQGVHGVRAFVGGEGADGLVEVLGGGFVR